MSFKLKNGPAFQVSDGPMRGCVYEPDKVYDVIPPQHAGLFVETDAPQQKRTRKNEVIDENTTGEA
jgi:hypothetical protein